MQFIFRLTSVIALALMTLTACKKMAADATSTANSAELKIHADDHSQVSNQIEAGSNEASIALESSKAFFGRLQGTLDVICDASVTFDSVSNPRTITIVYNGSGCHPLWSRTGAIILSVPKGVQWKDAGATITVSYQNVKITHIPDNKSITISGSHSLTNVSGGSLYNLSGLQSITHSLSSNGMLIRFDDSTQRTWQVARKQVFTYNNGIVTAITGNHIEGSNTGIAEWGLNRYGHPFTTSITQPLVISQDCSFRLTAGEVKHEGFATATASFGLDANGNPTSCPGTGFYYMKLSWTGPANNTYTAIVPYY